MAHYAWKATASSAWNNATNWDGAIPASSTANSIIFNDQSTAALTDFTTAPLTSESFNVTVEPGFNFYIGTSGTQLTLNDCPLCYFAGSGITSSYLSFNTLTALTLDSRSTKDDILVLSSNGTTPTINRINVKNGKMSLAAGPGPTNCNLTNTVITVGSAAGSQTTAELTIPASGITTSATTLFLFGGKVTSSEDIQTVIMSGGEFILSGDANVETLYMTGGTFVFDSYDQAAGGTVGKITTAEINGGVLRTRISRRFRTITNLNVYPGGVADFSIGGMSMSITTMRDFTGGVGIKPPRGAKIAWSFS